MKHRVISQIIVLAVLMVPATACGGSMGKQSDDQLPDEEVIQAPGKDDAAGPAAATVPPPTAPAVPPTATVVLATARPTSEPSDSGHIERGQITSQALADNLIGDPATRDFLIYLPASYDTSEKRYPAVYVLHGFGGDEWDLADLSIELSETVASSEGEEMIFVFVDGSNSFGGSWYLSSPTIGDYEGYIVSELVNHIDLNYRTLPGRDSRGITGCSMGGDGALHLALKYPDVFSVAVPMSGIYIGERDPFWDRQVSRVPESFNDLRGLGIGPKSFIAAAAAAASNPDKPPFYLDMPFEEIEGEVQIVEAVYKKINAVYPVNDVRPYLDQPVRLNGLMIYHGEFDGGAPAEVVRDFDRMLTDLGVEHEYLEVKKSHCDLDYSPMLNFMSDHLVFGQ